MFMGDNYCTTASSFEQTEGHKDRQAVDYIFTDQAPDSLEEEEPSPPTQKVADQPASAAYSEDSQRKGETNILKRFFSMFSSTTSKGGMK